MENKIVTYSLLVFTSIWNLGINNHQKYGRLILEYPKKITNISIFWTDKGIPICTIYFSIWVPLLLSKFLELTWHAVSKLHPRSTTKFSATIFAVFYVHFNICLSHNVHRATVKCGSTSDNALVSRTGTSLPPGASFYRSIRNQYTIIVQPVNVCILFSIAPYRYANSNACKPRCIKNIKLLILNLKAQLFQTIRIEETRQLARIISHGR